MHSFSKPPCVGSAPDEHIQISKGHTRRGWRIQESVECRLCKRHIALRGGGGGVFCEAVAGSGHRASKKHCR